MTSAPKFCIVPPIDLTHGDNMRFFLLAILLLFPGLSFADSPSPLIIGTGAVTGIYFPAAGAVQRLVNQQENASVRLAVESTAGSVANLKALAAGTLDLAIAQSDWATYAFTGGQEQFPSTNPDLRVLLALHSELLTVIVRSDSKINSLDELKGKRINLGPAGSGPRSIMSGLFQTLGWGVADMGALNDLPFASQGAALCEDKVDAIVFIVPHPNAAVQDALSRCPTKLLPISGSAVEQFVTTNTFYAKATIPGGLYAGQAADVPSFGVRALLIGSSKLPETVAYAIAKAALSNVAQLNATHPALARLTAADMTPNGFTVPLHPGVVKYLTEIGTAPKPPTP